MTDERPKMSLLEDLQDLDRKLVRLIARRAEILQKLSARRHQSSRAAARFAAEEKELRRNWEQTASRLSRDGRFLRDTFALLQEITLIPEHLEERKDSLYNLAPPRKPVHFELPAPTAQRAGLLWTAAAAAWGAELQLEEQSLSDSLVELIKALNQAGAHLSWEKDALVRGRGGEPLVFADKTIFAGSLPLNFYLLSALALGKPGVVKFTGDSALKLYDFSVWRNAMPLFGARLAHVIPKTRGLPVHLECSGLIPDKVSLPPDLPEEALVALFVAASAWEKQTCFPDNKTPAFAAARAEVLPLLAAAGVRYETSSASLTIYPAQQGQSLCPRLCLDERFALLLLGFALMNGGEAALCGRLPDGEAAGTGGLLEKILAWAGADFEYSAGAVRVKGRRDAQACDPLHLHTLPAWAAPFALVFGARRALQGGGQPRFCLTAGFAGFDLETGREFLQLLGADLEALPSEQSGQELWQITASSPDAEEEPKGGVAALWTAPDPDWGLAMTLGSCLRPNISLTNPALISKVFPAFWAFFNSLPNPVLASRDREQPPAQEKLRRKVIARGADSDLGLLRADYTPPDPEE